MTYSNVLPAQAGERLPCEMDPGLFFTSSETDARNAKTLCLGCPVRAECLAGAIERREHCGVWGGEVFRNGRIAATLRPPRKSRRVERKSVDGANPQRAQEAAARTCAEIRHALAVLPVGALTAHQLQAAKLRLDHPDLSLGGLGKLASPPISSAAMASRLRHVLRAAGARPAEGVLA